MSFNFYVLLTMSICIGSALAFASPSRPDRSNNTLGLRRARGKIQNHDNQAFDEQKLSVTRIEQKPTRYGSVVPQPVGKRCKFNDECLSGCCLVGKRNNRRRCAPKSLLGQRCNDAQVKGGAHIDFCGCAIGQGFCLQSPKRKRVTVCTL